MLHYKQEVNKKEISICYDSFLFFFFLFKHRRLDKFMPHLCVEAMLIYPVLVLLSEHVLLISTSLKSSKINT